MNLFKNFNISTAENHDEFVAIDDERSDVFQEAILKEENRFIFEKHQVVDEN